MDRKIIHMKCCISLVYLHILIRKSRVSTKYDRTKRAKVSILKKKRGKQGSCFSTIFLTLTANALPGSILKVMETSKEEDKQFSLWNIQRKFCYWLSKKRWYLEWLIDQFMLADVMEWKWVWKKTEVMRMSRQPSPLENTIGQNEMDVLQ